MYFRNILGHSKKGQGLIYKCFHKVGGSVLIYNKRRGFFCKKVKRWEVSLLNRGKARGFWAYCPVLFLPSRWETGEGEVARRRCRIRRPGARGGSGVRGKGSGRPAKPIPGRSSGGVVPGRSGSDGGRRRAAVALGRCPKGAAVSKGRGKSITGLRELDSPAHLG